MTASRCRRLPDEYDSTLSDQTLSTKKPSSADLVSTSRSHQSAEPAAPRMRTIPDTRAGCSTRFAVGGRWGWSSAYWLLPLPWRACGWPFPGGKHEVRAVVQIHPCATPKTPVRTATSKQPSSARVTC